MSIGDLCNREVVVIEPGASISAAVRLMRDYHVGDLVVVEQRGVERVPVGMLTDRDIVIKVMAEEIDPYSTSVGNLMTTELVTASEGEDLVDVVGRMRSRGVRRVPVVNTQGGLEGILAVDDILDLLAEQLTGLVGLVRVEQRHERERTAGG